VKNSQSAAVIGVGSTAFGNFPEEDATTLGIAALHSALQDAGLQMQDIDGLILHRVADYQRFVRTTGLQPRFMNTVPGQGRMTGVAIQAAASAILSGAAKTIALVHGNDGRSVGARYGGLTDRYGTGAEQLWFPYGMTSPGAVNALQFQRHMKKYGTTSEQLAAVAVAFRKHAGLNPLAVMQKPITVEDHQNSRFICEPLHLLDYCLINDGGVAMILTSAERARDAKQPAAYLRGFAMASRLSEGEFSDDFGRECMRKVADDVFAMAGVGPEDINALMIYDNFSPSVMFNLEGYGFCPVGESGRWIQDGRLELTGQYPTNTNGGHLSESYMQGWSLNVEAVRQIRADCGARQVPDAHFVQYLSGGPISTSIIYGSQPV
jgi:acetyl-CoA acetyltransferase